MLLALLKAELFQAIGGYSEGMRQPTVFLQPLDGTEPSASDLDPAEVAQLSPHARAGRRADFIGGRRAAKAAAREHFGCETLTLARERAPRKDAPELFSRHQGELRRLEHGWVSIAHQAPLAAAAAFDRTVGIDLVEAQSVGAAVDALLFTKREVHAWDNLVRTSSAFDDATGRDALFAIKECVLKIAGEGLRLPPLSFEVFPENATLEGAAIAIERLVVEPTARADPALKQTHLDPMPLLRGRLRRHAALIEGLLWDTTSTTNM